ncbi:DNA alkylation repair protein [Patescibacteria group bacterium]
MSNTLSNLKSELKKLSNPEKIKVYQWFFKTGKGEYGEGDIFIGLTMPQIRATIKNYINLSLSDIQKLLDSKIHEFRMAGLLILVKQFEKLPFVILSEAKDPLNSKKATKKKIFDFYLKNTKRINNWDLVDVTCTRIVSAYLLDKKRSILYKLAKSKNLWERRIAIVSTGAFIWQNDFSDTIKICEILLKDKHDLIHKACGWMLREVGKRDKKTLIIFLNQHTGQMPRVMLRYAIEKFNKKERKFYLNKK